MSDRELLARAAKAAGLLVQKNTEVVDADDRFIGIKVRATERDRYARWNPLTDDGDALRLAVTLRIEVDYFLADVQAKHDDCDPVFELFSEHVDPFAATRRAIVRAAAALQAPGAAPGAAE